MYNTRFFAAVDNTRSGANVVARCYICNQLVQLITVVTVGGAWDSHAPALAKASSMAEPEFHLLSELRGHEEDVRAPSG